MSKAPHIERMEDELQELGERLTKLNDFILQNPIFSSMEDVDRSLMQIQLSAMTSYHSILKTRLERALA